MQTPNLFEYSDYRQFLKDFYTTRKSDDKNFSYRAFSLKAGFGAPNIYHLVMTGKRNLTEESAIKFANTLELNKKEQQFFKILVSFNQSKTSESRRYFLEILHNIKKDKIGTPLKNTQFEYVSNWHYVVIRELVTLPHFKEDPVWISKKLNSKITVRQAREAIDKLLLLGLVKRNDDGRLTQADDIVVTDSEMAKTAVYSFHQQMLSLAKDILASATTNNHEISGTTLAVSEKQFKELKRMIQEFHESVQIYMAKNPDVPKTVFQLNVQMFPLTANDEGDLI